jgi:hypothetical protein
MVIEIRLLSHCGSTSVNVCSIAPPSVKCVNRLFIIRHWQYGDRDEVRKRKEGREEGKEKTNLKLSS